MKPTEQLQSPFPFKPSVILTDIDDTLTWQGKLPPEAFQAINQLKEAGIPVIPVTGASCGWCDCIVRTWPIDTIIGENGAFIISNKKKHQVEFLNPPVVRQKNKEKLTALSEQVFSVIPDAKLTHDTRYRVTDIAFDIGQDQKLRSDQVHAIADICKDHGATVRISSIHINVWFGNHTKASTASRCLQQLDIDPDKTIFIGDSPNDEDMFYQFTQTVGVANIKPFLKKLTHKPTFITAKPGGFGFAEFADAVLADR